jgi:hypothetical protein
MLVLAPDPCELGSLKSICRPLSSAPTSDRRTEVGRGPLGEP